MRAELINEMRAVSEVLSMRDVTSVEAFAARLLEESADELEKFEKDSLAHRSSWLRPSSVFLSGKVTDQIKEINKEREASGLSPL